MKEETVEDSWIHDEAELLKLVADFLPICLRRLRIHYLRRFLNTQPL